MTRRDETPRDLLFGLLALQNGMIDQDQLIGAFSAWSRHKSKPLAEILVNRGVIDDESRDLLAAMAEKHLKLQGGDAEKSLAAVATGHSTRQKLAAVGDPELNASLDFLGTQSPPDDTYATAAFGAITRDGHRFRVLRPHAQGGLGAVYVAMDGELNREVALKEILDRHADNPASRSRFMIEAEITGGLEHPGIVPVYGLGHYLDGRPYYAMRFIRGDTLKEAIAAFHSDESLKRDPGKRSLALRKLLRRFIDVCNAIDYAHGRGVLHRDLKPGNVIVGRYGETLVVDWGLAKAVGKPEIGSQTDERALMPFSGGSADTLPGSAIGTPAFMSPEQAVGDLERIGACSDVYSLGATLYCLLTGNPPFEGQVGDVLRDVQKGNFPPPRQLDPTIDKALEAVCLKAMALKPEDRHTTARALADDIDRWAADEPTSAWHEPVNVRIRRWMRRNRTAVAVAAVALLATLVGTAAVLAVQTQANEKLSQANEKLSDSLRREKEDSEMLSQSLKREKETNTALAASVAKEKDANAALTQANVNLAAAKDREAARFALATEAIRLFHGQIGDDLVLKEKQFKPLRDKLLQAAADFYGKLEKLLEGQNDPASRKSLGQAYYDLGNLTKDIGDRTKALEVIQRGLAIRQELAAASPHDDKVQLELVESQIATAALMTETGRDTEALVAYQATRAFLERLPQSGPGSENRRRKLGSVYNNLGLTSSKTSKNRETLELYRKALAIQQELAAANPTVSQYRYELATSYNNIAMLLSQTGKPAEALESYRKAMAILQGLADVHHDVIRYQNHLAASHNNIGLLLSQTGKPAEALESYRKAMAILQDLADANPAVTEFRDNLGESHNSIGILLSQTGKLAEALESHRKALAIRQDLADANPTVNEFRSRVATSHNNIGLILSQTGKPAEALESHRKSIAIRQELADANPTVNEFRSRLATSHNNIGLLLSQTGKPTEALESYRKALAIRQELADANPTVTQFRSNLANSHNNIGALLSRTGKLAEALESHRKALAIEEELAVANPTVTQFRNQLATSLNNIGLLLLRTDKPAEALESHRKALAIEQELADANPTVTDYRSRLATSHNNIGLLLSKTGKPAEALEPYRKALTIRRELADKYPETPGYRNDLAISQFNSAEVLRAVGQLDEAIAAYGHSIAIREELVKTNPNVAVYRSSLASSMRRLGLARLAGKDASGAVAETRKALALYDGLTTRSSSDLFGTACCHATLAAASGVEGSGLSAEEGEAEVKKALDILGQAIAKGYHNADTIQNEAAFDALRSRADFQRLMKNLEASPGHLPVGEAPE